MESIEISKIPSLYAPDSDVKVLSREALDRTNAFFSFTMTLVADQANLPAKKIVFCPAGYNTMKVNSGVLVFNDITDIQGAYSYDAILTDGNVWVDTNPTGNLITAATNGDFSIKFFRDFVLRNPTLIVNHRVESASTSAFTKFYVHKGVQPFTKKGAEIIPFSKQLKNSDFQDGFINIPTYLSYQDDTLIVYETPAVLAGNTVTIKFELYAGVINSEAFYFENLLS